jgi:hypothetical protein
MVEAPDVAAAVILYHFTTIRNLGIYRHGTQANPEKGGAGVPTTPPVASPEGL